MCVCLHTYIYIPILYIWPSVWWSPPPEMEMVPICIRIHTRLCKYVCIYMLHKKNICMYICICVYMSVCLSVCLPACLPACLPGWLAVCLSVMYVCMDVCMSVCMCGCMYVCLCIPPANGVGVGGYTRIPYGVGAVNTRQGDHMYVYIYKYIYVYVCIYINKYMYMYVYIYK